MKTYFKNSLLSLTAASLLVGSAACSDTALRGEVDDSEVRDPALVPSVVIGTAREQNDLIHSNGEHFRLSNMTDLIVLASTAAFDVRHAIGDMRNRDLSWVYEQAHEAAWSAYKAADLLQGVLSAEEYSQSLLVARSWINASVAERVLGDHQCEIIYQYGPFGGRSLGNFAANAPAGFPGYDGANIVGKDSIFQRVIYAANFAIDVANAAKAAGATPPAEDPGYFDADAMITAAHGQLAYAYHALATRGFDEEANWAAALANAALVPTDFVELSLTDDQTRSNGNWSLSWANDDNTLWSGVINGERWGSAIGYLGEDGDARVGEIRKCQDYLITDGDEAIIRQRDNVVDLPDAAGPCDSAFRAGTTDLEIREIPRWLATRYQERYHAVPLIEGTDMRLIEAERALRQGDLPLFTTRINEVRTFYGATPIAQPATVGALEYPNALDDGWSMLDRELVLNEAGGDYRRLGHLDRLNHPYITENAQVHPFFRDEFAESGLLARYSCLPLPQSECTNNGLIQCPDLM